MGKNISKLIEKTSLMDINIRYGKDKIKFNLFEELQINERKINREIKEQPSYFGFLSLLLVKLEKVRDDKKATLENTHSRLYLKYKKQIDPNTNRVYSKESAEALVSINKDFQKSVEDYNRSKENFGIIKTCVDSFSTRGYLIQTLSANVRKEKQV